MISMEAINWQKLKSIEAFCVEKTFLKAIEIWLLKPHVVNRRLAGAVMRYRTRIDHGPTLDKFVRKFSTTTSCEFSDDLSAQQCIETLTKDNFGVSCDEVGFKSNIPESEHDKEVKHVKEHCSLSSTSDGSPRLKDDNARFEFCVRKLVPRSTIGEGCAEETVNEIIIIDYEDCSATFILLQNAASNKTTLLQTAYRLAFSLKTSRINLSISGGYKQPRKPSQAVACPTIAWLEDCLLPKIAKWASEVSPDAPVHNSQALVSVERYSALYGQLKKKYGAKFVEIWPENTDPLKFVYEDVAIATYLILLWEREQAEKALESPQSFVDLGCGNGLLVHILNSEGYPGKGIDLRRRKIWDLYGPETNLEECSITPSDSFLFPDYDWLIGNHSDELTPWIPVMAARSSYATSYFVLPCCFHDFDTKFMRTDQSKTQYRGYLDFVGDVGRVCGFQVVEDILRIPSTKRICQIGHHRTYPPKQSDNIQHEITAYIASRRYCDGRSGTSTSQAPNTGSSCGDQTRILESDTKSSVPSDQWAPHFHPREKVEPVRNCARVDYDLRQMIVNRVACSILTDAGVDLHDSVRGKKEKLWRKGGSLTFAEIAKLFDSETLKQLKSECGGLKTLLKNFHQIFQVSGDSVEIRDWSEATPAQEAQEAQARKQTRRNSRRTDAFKTRLCWFNAQHPDGCPRVASRCQFAHGNVELRKIPAPPPPPQ